MHELSITRHIIDMIIKESKGKKPKKVYVELGMLTPYKKDPIEFYFDLLKKEEPSLKCSKIVVEEIDGTVLCKDCGKESIIEPYMVFCPDCDSSEVQITKGKDFKLAKIDY